MVEKCFTSRVGIYLQYNYTWLVVNMIEIGETAGCMFAGKHSGKAVDWMDASGKETSLWQRMLERPNLWVESCLPLRPSLDVRSTS